MLPEDVWDIPIILVWICIGVVSITSCLGLMQKQLRAYNLADKTAVVNVSDNTEEPIEWTVREYLLMLFVADEFQPDPAAVDIQFAGSGGVDTTIKFDQDYQKNKAGRIQRYYIDFLSNKVDKKITNVEYVYDWSGNGKWRFTID